MCRYLIVAVVAGIALTILPQSANAEPASGNASGEPGRLGLPAGFRSWGELFDVQRPLDDAATRIEDVASADPLSGYTSVTVDAAARTLTVYLRGKPTAAESAVLDSLRSQGINVTLVAAKYSRTELDTQVSLIEQDVTSTGTERVTHITKKTDGSGIEVGVATKAMTQSGLGNTLTHLTSARRHVEISVVPGSTSGSPALLRESDSPQFWGGALVRYSSSTYCSSGFAVHWPADGNDYMTTAAHCLGVGQTYSNGNFTWTMGPGTPGNTGYDLMFIRTAAGAAGRIYTGPRAYTAGQGSMPVTRASHTHVGDSLCTGGAATGWHCFIRASGPTRDCRPWVATVGLGNCFNVEGGITTVTGQLIAGHGDSGGPVWTPINGFDQPNSSADARGLISSRPDGWPDIPCGNDPVFNQPNTCSTAVWYTDIVSAINPWVVNGGMFVKTQ